ARQIGESSTLRGVYNFAASQAINRVAGLQTSFSWSGLAASVVGANVAGAAVGLAQPVLPGDMIGKIISGQIAAHTAAVVKDK
ncbi:hypothetical protein ABTG06_19530, partial [Acinetobacter baumannii]